MFTQKNRDELEAKGVTVVAGVLPQEDCDRHQQYFREWLARFPEGTFPQSRNSLIQRYRTGFMTPAWEARLAAKPVFAQVWGTDKLLTSIDAIAIGRPPEQGEEKFWEPTDNWLHLDQRADRVGLHAYQGAVYLEDCDEDDWNFEVIEGSHRHFSDFMNRTQQWACRNINKADMEWFERKGCRRKRVPCPKGGLVLWDSRTVHANARPVQGRQHPDRWRFVIFVCMAPAAWAQPSDLHTKRQAYREMRLTNHWPSQQMNLFSAHIRRKEAPDPGSVDELPDIAKTDEVKRLVGVLPYESRDGGGEKEEEEEEEEPAFRPQWDTESWSDVIEAFKKADLNAEGKHRKGKKPNFKA